MSAIEELALLRADKARLDWIEREVHDFEFHFRQPGMDRDCKNCANTGRVFRAVVDAAMRVTSNIAVSHAATQPKA